MIENKKKNPKLKQNKQKNLATKTREFKYITRQKCD